MLLTTTNQKWLTPSDFAHYLLLYVSVGVEVMSVSVSLSVILYLILIDKLYKFKER